jgi:hypothetical protein
MLRGFWEPALCGVISLYHLPNLATTHQSGPENQKRNSESPIGDLNSGDIPREASARDNDNPGGFQGFVDR